MSMNKTKIEWCDYTWSPVTGCLHGCSYCYARKIAERFKGGKAWPNGFAPMLHLERMNDPQKLKKPQTIFVCSMADLFGNWVPDGWVNTVFMSMLRAPQHTYIMLTKDPNRAGHRLIDNFYQFGERLCPSKIPKNWWIGASVESSRYTGRIDDLRRIPTGNRFVSFEPLLGDCNSKDFPLDLHEIKQVIIGAQTNPSVEVTPEMIQPIGAATCPGVVPGIKMFCKDSMPRWACRRELCWPLNKPLERSPRQT